MMKLHEFMEILAFPFWVLGALWDAFEKMKITEGINMATVLFTFGIIFIGLHLWSTMTNSKKKDG